MLSEEQQQLFQIAKQAQVTRSEAVHIITSTNNPNLLHGTFIRVLLELFDHREHYIIARVGAITRGELYGGFSTNASVRTDKYLVLVLPPFLASINGTQYQLNSVSNSTITGTEFARWLEMMQPFTNIDNVPQIIPENADIRVTLGIPQQQELSMVAERLRSVVGGGRHGHAVRSGHGSQVGQVMSQQTPVSLMVPQENRDVLRDQFVRNNANDNNNNNNNNNNGNSFGGVSGFFSSSSNIMGGEALRYTNGIGGVVRFAGQAPGMIPNTNDIYHDSNNNNQNQHHNVGNVDDGSQAFRPFNRTPSPLPPMVEVASIAEINAGEKDFDLPTHHQVRQDVINKMSQRSVLFPQNISELKVSQLRLTERDMIEYLEHVREAISSEQENCVVCMDHVPTVISLPCRHKVLCRLCASSVSTCPVCRSHLFELFEPKEI